MIKEYFIKRFIKWLIKHYPTYWEIVTIYKNGQKTTKTTHHVFDHDVTYKELECELKNNSYISLIVAEKWINIKGLEIRIELENTKIAIYQ